MFQVQIIFISLIVLISARPQQRISNNLSTPPPSPPPPRTYTPSPYELEQNRAAQYKFATNIEDHISDQTQQRTETRNGLKVEGSYSYSDGYVKRTVFYEADEQGYRVIKQDVEPLNGPNVDLSGTASISSAAHGKQISYRVQSVPAPGPIAKVID